MSYSEVAEQRRCRRDLRRLLGRQQKRMRYEMQNIVARYHTNVANFPQNAAQYLEELRQEIVDKSGGAALSDALLEALVRSELWAAREPEAANQRGREREERAWEGGGPEAARRRERTERERERERHAGNERAPRISGMGPEAAKQGREGNGGEAEGSEAAKQPEAAKQGEEVEKGQEGDEHASRVSGEGPEAAKQRQRARGCEAVRGCEAGGEKERGAVAPPCRASLGVASPGPRLVITEVGSVVRLQHGSLKFTLPRQRFRYLRKQADDEAILALLMRYDKFSPKRGFFWSMSPYLYRFLNKFYPDCVEAFASPLNNNLDNYCSLYEEDRRFGAIGPFDALMDARLAAPPGDELVAVVNPPYTEAVLEHAYRRVAAYLARRPGTFILMYPHWPDLPSVQGLLGASPYHRSSVVVDDHLLYNHLTERHINPPIRIVFALLGSGPAAVNLPELIALARAYIR